MLLSGYEVRAHVSPRNGKSPVTEFLNGLRVNVQKKIRAYIALLEEHGGRLEYPYTSHVEGPLRELRVDFARDRHRIFFFATDGRKIILLHGFLKRSQKLPRREIETARKYLEEYLRYRIDAPLS